ncbi:RING1 and YY1-binding protein [Clonorchis sinensis]|uniref:RING1 and YY1-binding protein n=1 Tax=Clonorchis sinensis TaxID=79923 RepID=H2KPE3_CLOSI|nr:RING1 and YY1-binding protein [Clonorchis sinensis]
MRTDVLRRLRDFDHGCLGTVVVVGSPQWIRNWLFSMQFSPGKHCQNIVQCKRKARGEEDDRWECSVCTYMNPSESYKCEICFMRKGTSTRKPRLNPQVVEQQQLIAQAILKEKDEEHRRRKTERCLEKTSSLGSENFCTWQNRFETHPHIFRTNFRSSFRFSIKVELSSGALSSEYDASHTPKPFQSAYLMAGWSCQYPGKCYNGFPGGIFSSTDQLSPTDSNSTVDASHKPISCGESELFESVETKARCSFPSNKVGHSSSGKSTHTSSLHESVSLSTPFSKTTGRSLAGSNCSNDNMTSHLVSVKQDETSEPPDREPKSSSSTSVPCSSRRIRLRRLQHTPAAQPMAKGVFNTCTVYDGTDEAPDSSTCERLLAPSQTNQPPSSRLRRHRFHFDPQNTYVFSTPQSKCSKGHSRGLNLAKSGSQRYLKNSTKSRPIGSRTDVTWSSKSRQKTSARRPLRITVSRVNTSTTSKHCKYESSLPASSPGEHHPTKRRHSTTRSSLKCKIRVRSSAHEESLLSEDTDNVVREALLVTKKSKILSDSPKIASPESPTPNQELNVNSHTNLSTESRNTSAMTDSSGASALEMSR